MKTRDKINIMATFAQNSCTENVLFGRKKERGREGEGKRKGTNLKMKQSLKGYDSIEWRMMINEKGEPLKIKIFYLLSKKEKFSGN